MEILEVKLTEIHYSFNKTRGRLEDERVKITVANKKRSGSNILGDFFSFEIVEKFNELLEEFDSPITQIFSKLP